MLQNDGLGTTQVQKQGFNFNANIGGIIENGSMALKCPTYRGQTAADDHDFLTVYR